MSAFIYIYRGVVLLISLLIPSKRRMTIERWKCAKPHRLIYEIGGGIIGVIVLLVLVLMILGALLGHNA